MPQNHFQSYFYIILIIVFFGKQPVGWAQFKFTDICLVDQTTSDKILNYKRQLDINISDKIILSETKKLRIEAMFSEVKKLALRALTANESRTTQTNFDLIKNKILNSQIYFNENLLDLNAYTKYDTTTDNLVLHIGALANLVDISAESLFFILAHEMGHITGPTYFYTKSFYNNKAPAIEEYSVYYPFHEPLSCVAKKANLPDLECLENSIQNVSPIFFAQLIATIRATIKSLQLNPYVSTLLSPAGTRGCQIGQAEESFADLFAAEIIYQKYKSSKLLLTYQNRVLTLNKLLGFMCAQDRVETVLGYDIRSTYLKSSDRIENIILSHKGIRSAFKVNINQSEDLVCEF